jgi:2-dehydro-3-deoxyphosphooctonate aldolase (KDO 8-P synthase)
VFRHAEQIKAICEAEGVQLVFKCSYDKANRTSTSGFRGPGIEEGLKILAEVRRELNIPVVSDVHNAEQCSMAAQVLDLLQIPAFLCRQTDLIVAAASTLKPVMIKKGQFVAPQDMEYAAGKAASTGNTNIALCERGSCFGYRELVVDMRSLDVMKKQGTPVVFDATHSVQVMGGAGGSSGGNREYVSLLTRAAVAVGIDGLFVECHEAPDRAMSDGPNMLPISQLSELLSDVKALHDLQLRTRG